MGEGRWIFVLDDDQDLREALIDLLAYLDTFCIALPSVEAMIAARDEVLACGLAILDVNLGEGRPSGIDAHLWLRERGFTGRIVFLTGHAPSHPEVARAAS